MEAYTLDAGDVLTRLASVGVRARLDTELRDTVVTIPTEGAPIVMRRSRCVESNGPQSTEWETPWTLDYRGHRVPMAQGWASKVKLLVAWEASMEGKRARVVRGARV